MYLPLNDMGPLQLFPWAPGESPDKATRIRENTYLMVFSIRLPVRVPIPLDCKMLTLSTGS